MDFGVQGHYTPADVRAMAAPKDELMYYAYVPPPEAAPAPAQIVYEHVTNFVDDHLVLLGPVRRLRASPLLACAGGGATGAGGAAALVVRAPVRRAAPLRAQARSYCTHAVQHSACALSGRSE